MKRMTPGTELDGFRVGECLHAGGMAHVLSLIHISEPTRPY